MRLASGCLLPQPAVGSPAVEGGGTDPDSTFKAISTGVDPCQEWKFFSCQETLGEISI